MTVRELISELNKYPPDAEVRLETYDGSISIDHVDHNKYPQAPATGIAKIFAAGWDEPLDDEDEECDECGELIEDCDCDDHEPFHVESSDSFDPRSDDEEG